MNAAPRRQAGSGRAKRFLLRLPEEMMTHIDACAAASFRKRNAEILMRLKASMDHESMDEHGVIIVAPQRAASDSARRGHP